LKYVKGKRRLLLPGKKRKGNGKDESEIDASAWKELFPKRERGGEAG